jgi:hypothetical protein
MYSGAGAVKRLITLALLLIAVTLVVAASRGIAQQNRQLFELENKIPLGTVNGRIDHLAFNSSRKHVFVAELENNSLGVVDLGNGRLLHRITGLSEPQGVGYVPSVDTLFVADGGDGTVRVFKGGDFAPIGLQALRRAW